MDKDMDKRIEDIMRKMKKMKKIDNESKESSQYIIVDIKTPITPEVHERLEEKLKELFENEGLDAIIDNLVTGNTTMAKNWKILNIPYK